MRHASNLEVDRGCPWDFFNEASQNNHGKKAANGKSYLSPSYYFSLGLKNGP